MISLRRTLLIWLTALLAVIGLISAVASYILAGDEAAELSDTQLRQIALYVGQVPADFRLDTVVTPTFDPEEDEDDFLIQVWRSDGTLMISSNPAMEVPRQPTAGFATTSANKVDWRVYTAIDQAHIVQVSQQMEVREELAASASLQAALPIALLIPLSWLVLNWIVRWVIGRLDRVTAKVAEREASGVEPIPLEDAPTEVAPLLSAMNDLVQRLKAALEQQRRFVADAAHELRTPLAAVSLQVDNLAATLSQDARYSQRLSDLRAGTARASAVVGQLLRLARFEAGAPAQPSASLALRSLVLDSLARFAPLAEHRSIDLGLSAASVSTEAVVFGVKEEIEVLIDNILDNAIRYTPAGGTVDVLLRGGARPAIEVSDSGPGIPDSSLARVFTRFFRADPSASEGSGLGLAIAKAAADRNGIDLSLANRTDRGGLLVRMVFSGRQRG